MSFPQDPRIITTELYVNDAWTKLETPNNIRQEDGITIKRGRPNEASKAQHSTCELTLDNRASHYSPDWPTGPYYGSLDQNTPVRLGVHLLTDTFTRTVSGGWGSTDNGQAWSITGVGAPLLASDWNVSGGTGTMSQPVATGYRLSYLNTVSYRDVDVRMDVTLAFSDVIGGQIEPGNICLRGQSVTEYYLVRLVVTTTETVTISILHYDGTVIAPAVTVAGLTHTGQTLRVRFQAEKQTLRAKVWGAAGKEPYAWQVIGHSTSITQAGFIAVRNGVGSGNTNTKPIVFTCDNVVVTSPRFSGEVASWPQNWDTSGRDVTVNVEAAGILRRLGQGADPIQSALRRGFLSDAIVTPVAYWPCEEGKFATNIASGLPGGTPMLVYGTPQFQASTVFAASAALPYPKTSYWIGYVPSYTTTGRQQVRFLLGVAAAGIPAQSLIAVGTSGTIKTWLVRIDAAGSMAIRAFNSAGTIVLDTPFTAFAVNGSPRQVALEFEQVGADVTTNLLTLEPGAATGLQMPLGGSTILNQTVGVTTYVQVGSLGDTTVGHVSVHATWSSLFDLGDQLAAFDGEAAGRRIERLCTEQDIDFSYSGNLDDTALMGPQRAGTLRDLLVECADADLGMLYESRGALGIAYRTFISLTNQAITLDLDYSAGEISLPFQPVKDDRFSRNDITVTRKEGSEARAVLETGSMSVLPASQGGIGRYAEGVTLNLYTDNQLQDMAGTLLHFGTVGETRYPSIRVNLANPEVVAAGLENTVLALNVGDRFTVSNPKSGQTPDQINQLMLGYTETVNSFEHTVDINCVPASPYNIAVLDANDTRMDSDTTTLNADVNTVGTSLVVAIADDTLWTTDAGEMPFSITVGGEEMSLTAVSGTASPQTFTVIRSINGVVKTHKLGTPVHVTHPVVIAPF